MRSNRGCECFYDFLCRVKAERSFVCFHPCSPGEAQFICNKPAVYEISSPRFSCVPILQSHCQYNLNLEQHKMIGFKKYNQNENGFCQTFVQR